MSKFVLQYKKVRRGDSKNLRVRFQSSRPITEQTRIGTGMSSEESPVKPLSPRIRCTSGYGIRGVRSTHSTTRSSVRNSSSRKARSLSHRSTTSVLVSMRRALRVTQ